MNNQQAINLLKNLEQSLDDYCELNDEGISMSIILSIPNGHDYHTDLRNIAYKLSRIADALNRKEDQKEE